MPGGPGQAGAILLVRVGGDNQHALGLATLDQPLMIRAIDPVSLAPLAGLAIRFSVDHSPAGGAHLSDTIAVTNRDGVAQTELTLGDGVVNEVSVTARYGQALAEHFNVFVNPAPVVRQIVPGEVRSGDTITVQGTGLAIAGAPGVVRFNGTPVRALSASDSEVRVVVPPCLAPGTMSVTVTNGGARTAPATAQYVLRDVPVTLAPFGGIVLPAAQLADCVILAGDSARFLVVAQVESESAAPDSVDVEIGAGGAPGSVFVPPTRLANQRDATPRAFEAVLRRREAQLAATRARVVAPALAAARATATTPELGALASFTVISSLDASTFATAVTRLRYVGRNILLWVDTTTPAEVPDSSMQALARLFDEVLYPLDVDAFGETSDVDGNGRVHVVLTPIVNALTPRAQCSASGFVNGFFSAHDLYPGTPHANGGEVFYGFVPDSLGVFGCPHSPAEFSSAIRTGFVHELQHVINYQQHVFRRGGREEDVWLNEGLSHMAEELASKLYERRYPPPTGRMNPEQLFPDSSQNFISFNLVNAFLFLRQPFVNSLTHFNEGGTLEERGAAWLFLRWVADQYGEDILRRLVQTSLVGKENVADKTGEPFARLEGDFELATYVDSLPGYPRTAVPARWRYSSRNWRVLFERLHVALGFPSFPIVPVAIPYGGSVSGWVRTGGFVMLTVDVPPGSTVTTLRFVPHGATAWGSGQFAQVSIFRLP